MLNITFPNDIKLVQGECNLDSFTGPLSGSYESCQIVDNKIFIKKPFGSDGSSQENGEPFSFILRSGGYNPVSAANQAYYFTLTSAVLEDSGSQYMIDNSLMKATLPSLTTRMEASMTEVYSQSICDAGVFQMDIKVNKVIPKGGKINIEVPSDF